MILDLASQEPIARFRTEAPVGAPAGVSRTARQIHTGDDLPIYAVRYTPDGARLLSGDSEGMLRIHDARTAGILESRAVSHAAILAIDVNPDGRWGAIGLRGGGVQLHDLAGRGEPQQPLETFNSNDILAVAFSPDGRTLAWGGTGGAAVWDMATRRVIWSTATREQVNALSFDREGRRIVCGFENRSDQGSVGVWNAATGEQLAKLSSGRAGEEILSVSFSPDGRRIVVGSSEGLVHVFSTDPYELLISLEQPGSVDALAFTATGDHLISGLWNGDVTFWDVGNDPSMAAVAGHR